MDDISIVLLPDGEERIPLIEGERQALLERFPAIRQEARKWRAMTGQPGTLVVIDPEAIAAYRCGDLSA